LGIPDRRRCRTLMQRKIINGQAPFAFETSDKAAISRSPRPIAMMRDYYGTNGKSAPEAKSCGPQRAKLILDDPEPAEPETGPIQEAFQRHLDIGQEIRSSATAIRTITRRHRLDLPETRAPEAPKSDRGVAKIRHAPLFHAPSCNAPTGH
jgi:hypothetical protein